MRRIIGFLLFVLAACGEPANYTIEVPAQRTPEIFLQPPDVVVENDVTVTATVVLGCDANPVVCGQGTLCVQDMCLPAEVINPPTEECNTQPVMAGMQTPGQIYRPGDILHMVQVLIAPCGQLRLSRLRPWVAGTPIGLVNARAFTSSSAGQQVAVGSFWNDRSNSFADLVFTPPLTVERGERLTVSIWIETTTDIPAGRYIGGISEYEMPGGVINMGIDTIGGRYEWIVALVDESEPIDEPSYLVVARDWASPVARQFEAGARGVTLASFWLWAINHDQEVEEIKLTQLVTDTRLASFANYQLIWIEDRLGNRLASITPFNVQPILNFFPAMVVDSSTTAGQVVYLKADLSDICIACATTRGGDYLGYEISGPRDIVSRSAENRRNSMVLFSDPLPRGPRHQVFKATPVFTKQPIPGRLSVYPEVARLRIAARGGDIEVAKISLEIRVYGCSISYVEVVEITNPQIETILWSQNMNITDIEREIDVRLVVPGANGGLVVTENQPRTLVINVSASGVGSGDTIAVRVHGDSAQATIVGRDRVPGTIAEIEADEENDFIWSDRSILSHSSMTRDWQNGYLVTGLASMLSSAWVSSL